MRILIIKLGALGDVLRTTPLLTQLKCRYPASHISWLVDPKHAAVLEDNPLVDNLLRYSDESLFLLKKADFDWAVNLDKEPEALDAMTLARAEKKMGFGRSAAGDLCPLDSLSEYAYRLGIDDDLKFRRNKKTYQEITFEQLGLCFNKEEYQFPEKEEDRLFAERHLRGSGLGAGNSGKPTVGLNTGSGHRFTGKKLPLSTFAALAERFFREMGATVLLLGGKDEIERNKQLEKLCPCPVINTGSHSIRRFAALVKRCDLVVSGDTTAMHIAIARQVPVVAYFASTCAAEIELYGRGRKVISDISCAPCYLRICPIDEQCMKDMSVGALFDAAKEVLGESVIARAPQAPEAIYAEQRLLRRPSDSSQ